MKYIALLRGINVGGNNKVAMPELKKCFETIGLTNVSTYINSGNVLFESDQENAAKLVRQCEDAIKNTFGFHIVCSVISTADLHAALKHAPSWWNNGDAKHNAIFVIAPKKAEDIMKEVGEAKPEYEKVAAYHPIIFWSAPLKTFGRTRYSKIVGTKAYQSVTIRNANTTLKLAELSNNRMIGASKVL
jgi:uncharacterized protein (DUF1697 family)